MTNPTNRAERVLGRYALFDEIASGGMATVHLARMLGPVGFSKTVAIKRMHPNFARDPEFVSMFLDEARLAARIQHPNVVATLDVVSAEGEVFLVLDYVQGESLSHLLKATRIKGVPVTPRVVSSILVNTLHGLHAAHEATDEHGRPLGIVHRDVSPQNVLVGVDGVARVLDFGVAKAAGRLQNTRDGQLKGKLAYMAPEQIRGDMVDRRTDIYAASALLWEGLSGRRLIHGMNEGQVLAAVLAGGFPPPSALNPSIPPQIDAIVMRGLAMDPAQRWATAREMAIAVERTLGVASPYEVAEWTQSVGAEALAMRAARVREMESTSAVRVSLHEEGGPQIFHDAPRHEPSHSGVSSSSVSRPGIPRPPALPLPEGTGSVHLHPSFAASEASPPSWVSNPGFVAQMAAQQIAQAQPSAPAWQPAPLPVAAAPMSRAKVIVLSVAVSGMFGITVILLIFWFRARAQVAAADSGIESVPAKAAATATASAPAPAASASIPVAPLESAKAPPPTEPAIVDIPPVALEPPKKPAPEPAPEQAPSVKPEKTAATPTAKTAETAKTGSTSAAKTPKGCESPFFVDDKGIEQIKPECM